jgi:hypothetical protein
MLRRSFLELPLFGFLASKFKGKIESKFDVKQNPELSERESVKRFEIEPESFSKIEEIVLDWLESSKRSRLQIPFIRGEVIVYMVFSRSVINIKSCNNVWEQWHIATSSDFDKIISTRIKDVSTNNLKLLEEGFVMPNEVRSETYDGTSYI